MTCRYRWLRPARWRSDRIGCGSGLACSRLRRGQPARAGQQVEQDNDQHRRDERTDQHRRPRQSLRAVPLAADRPGGDPAEGQAGGPRWDRAPPAQPDAEQAPADPGQDHGGDQGEQPSEHRDTQQEARSAQPHRPSPRSAVGLYEVRHHRVFPPSVTPAIPASPTLGTSRLVGHRPAITRAAWYAARPTRHRLRGVRGPGPRQEARGASKTVRHWLPGLMRPDS